MATAAAAAVAIRTTIGAQTTPGITVTSTNMSAGA